MKLKELKHNHSLTDLLKILIFSVLMITPLLSVATRCLYVICNKNAYQSYYGETINQSENVYLKYSQLENNKSYYVNQINLQNPYQITVSENRFNVSNITNVIETSQHDYSNVNAFSIYNNGSALNLTFYFYEGSTFLFNTTAIASFEFTYLSSSQTNNKLSTFIDNNHFIYELKYNDYSYMDNVFEYSINKLQGSQVINWTANTGVYTGVSAMTTQLGIEGAVIPMLITYWFLLTIIYVIVDIVLKLFTVLTHLIGSKTT